MQRALTILQLNAAGIDIGSASHFVAVPPDRDDQPVREFPRFTVDLNALAVWLKVCRVDTVAMESTGVYWIPLFELLESRGLIVLLVNARHVKNVSGPKSDVLDCQWPQQLMTYGLLSGAFRPVEEVCVLRCLYRQRGMLLRCINPCGQSPARAPVHSKRRPRASPSRSHFMRISVSGAGSASFVAARSSSTKSAERQAFGQFTKALKANDLEGAKSADKSMVANAPAGASRDSDSAFAQLGKAIQSGDVSAAKSACVSMVKSRRSQAPVETAKPITVKAVIGGGVDSRINLSA